MSAEVFGWALRFDDLPLDQRTGEPSSSCAFVLVVLANHATPEGTDSFPSVETIRKSTKLTERTVRYALRALEEHGTIRRTPNPLRRDGTISDPRKRPTSYDIAPFVARLARDREVGSEEDSGGQSLGGKVDSGGQSPPSQGGKVDGDFAPEPLRTLKNQNQEQTPMPTADAAGAPEVVDLFGEAPPSTSKAKKPPTAKQPPDTGPQFERFWATYPRKIAKKKARSAWDKAVHEADPETLITAAATYAQRVDPRYVKHPATWLNGGCWEDDPAAVNLRLVSGDGYHGFRCPTNHDEYDGEF